MLGAGLRPERWVVSSLAVTGNKGSNLTFQYYYVSAHLLAGPPFSAAALVFDFDVSLGLCCWRCWPDAYVNSLL